MSWWSRAALGVCAVIAFVRPAAADPRAVIELFTSQGCSSCPPADKVLGDLARDPTIIALSLPIDYWDYLGWKDTLADSRFTARQRAYSRARGDREVYTPQAVVNGSVHVIGSDRDAIEGAIEETARGGAVMSVPVSLSIEGQELTVAVAAAGEHAPRKHGEVWVGSIARVVPIQVARGENGGRELTYYNVVRGLMKLGDWNGSPMNWSVPLDKIAREGVDGAVVYLQDGSRDRPGLMLGAALSDLPPLVSRASATARAPER
ncbi:DUF1223 domain-containing protein [Bradyrhizobium sp. HKCCYLR20261]|uniref:DUF1223 domain-containing protein n=1 Tax=unclassified Bradyrhizobium TaxID=2631580 RepID=UPI003EBC9EA9